MMPNEKEWSKREKECEGWMHLEDIEGISEDKLQEIREAAEFYASF
jgi:hypothetical protein